MTVEATLPPQQTEEERLRAEPIAVLSASVYGRQPEYYESMLQRMLPTSEHFFKVGRDRIAITRWLLELFSDDPADVEYDNFEDPRVLDPIREKARRIKAGD